MYVDGGSYISTNTLSLSSLSFTSCSASNGSNGIWISASTLSLLKDYDGWDNLLPSDYSSNYEGVCVCEYSNMRTDLLHLFFPPSISNVTVMYVQTDVNCGDTPPCGWEDFPCKTIGYAVSFYTVTELKLLKLSSTPEVESEGITFTHLPYYMIEGEREVNSSRVEKAVSNIADVLFTLKYCENVTFSSIAFVIQSSPLSHSLFFCTFSSLTLTSISLTPSDSTTS